MPRTGAADLARVLHKLLPECSGEYAYEKIKITNILLDILVLMLDLAEYVKLRAFFLFKIVDVDFSIIFGLWFFGGNNVHTTYPNLHSFEEPIEFSEV